MRDNRLVVKWVRCLLAVRVESVTTSAPLLGEPLPVELMNTLWADRGGLHDALDTPEKTLDWLADVAPRLDVPVPDELGSLSALQLAQVMTLARGLRDALRTLAADNTGDTRPAAVSSVGDTARALATLNKAAAHAPRWTVLEPAEVGLPLRRATLTGKSAAEAAVSQIADEAIALFGDGGGLALRACQGPGCVLYFLRQHPRREWCSVACGNRARVARHYRRHSTSQD